MTKYFKGQAQYVLGETYNNVGGINSLPADNWVLGREWSRAQFDQRQRFNLLGVFNPEKFFNLGVRVALNTGSPYSITTGRDENQDGVASDRPKGVPRNSMQGFGSQVLDLRWSKEFPLISGKRDEGPAIGVVVDAFNVLNHVNYTNVVGNLSSPFFGQPVAATAARRMQFTLRFKF